jgi:hypothetical protein
MGQGSCRIRTFSKASRGGTFLGAALCGGLAMGLPVRVEAQIAVRSSFSVLVTKAICHCTLSL